MNKLPIPANNSHLAEAVNEMDDRISALEATIAVLVKAAKATRTKKDAA